MKLHQDRTGDELRIGAYVVYLRQSKESSSLEFGEVVGMTDCFVRLQVPHAYRAGEVKTILISPSKTVRTGGA